MPETLSIGRDDFARALQEQGLGISVHFIPHFAFTFLKERYNLRAEDFPNAAARYAQSLSLPFWPDMSEDDIQYVIDTVIRTAERFRR